MQSSLWYCAGLIERSFLCVFTGRRGEARLSTRTWPSQLGHTNRTSVVMLLRQRKAQTLAFNETMQVPGRSPSLERRIQPMPSTQQLSQKLWCELVTLLTREK